MKLSIKETSYFVGTGGKPFDPELPTVLFVHGSGMDHRAWALQSRWFSHHGYSILAPDLPGHSLSDGLPLESIEEMGQWLQEMLSAAGAAQVHVVGHSQGFLAALELAKNAPVMVRSLTGIGTAATIPVNPALIETAQKSTLKAAEMMLQWGFGPGIHRGLSPVPGAQPISQGLHIMAHNPLAEDLTACANYKGGTAIAQSLTLPALMLLAGKDKMTPLKSGLVIAEALGAQTEILENFGHMLPVEAPLEVLHHLQKFIGDLEHEPQGKMT